MSGLTAVLCVLPDHLDGENCDVSVLSYDEQGLSDGPYWRSEIAVDAADDNDGLDYDDRIRAFDLAETALSESGYETSGQWEEGGDGAWYIDVEKVS